MDRMEAFFSDFPFIACCNVLLTGRCGLGYFLLKECSILIQTTPSQDHFTEAMVLIEDIHPSIHPFLSYLSWSGSVPTSLRCSFSQRWALPRGSLSAPRTNGICNPSDIFWVCLGFPPNLSSLEHYQRKALNWFLS